MTVYQVKLFDGWALEREINSWLAEHQDFEIINMSLQVVGPEADDSYPYVLVTYKIKGDKRGIKGESTTRN